MRKQNFTFARMLEDVIEKWEKTSVLNLYPDELYGTVNAATLSRRCPSFLSVVMYSSPAKIRFSMTIQFAETGLHCNRSDHEKKTLSVSFSLAVLAYCSVRAISASR